MKEQPITNNFQFSSPCDPPLLHPSCSDPGPLEEDHHNHRAGLRVVSVSRTGHVETKSMGTEGIQGGPVTRRRSCVVWERPPKTVLVVRSRGSRQAEAVLRQVVWWLAKEKHLQVIVENEVANHSPDLPAIPVGEDVSRLERQVDFVICLGGDGLILHVCSALFPRAVPPVMSFNLGSLGFLTPFDVERYKQEVNNILEGERNQVTLRMRLQCTVHRVASHHQPTLLFSEESSQESDHFAVSSSDDEVHDNSSSQPHGCGMCHENANASKVVEIHVLNDVVIDRGPAPFLSNLLCYCDEHPVTRIQADGIIIATPTGSTAYSLSSGGSMVHPAVPGILFTPICPHSLSFRPVIFPDYVTLRIKVPYGARGDAWISFDGRKRMELFKGDSVCVKVSKWPVTTFCRVDQTRDWFSAVTRCLHWNDRQEQRPFDCRLDRKASPRRRGLSGNKKTTTTRQMTSTTENHLGADEDNPPPLSLIASPTVKPAQECDETECKNAFRTPTPTMTTTTTTNLDEAHY